MTSDTRFFVLSAVDMAALAALGSCVMLEEYALALIPTVVVAGASFALWWINHQDTLRRYAADLARETEDRRRLMNVLRINKNR